MVVVGVTYKEYCQQTTLELLPPTLFHLLTLNDTKSSATTAIGVPVKIVMVASPGVAAGVGGGDGCGPHPPGHTHAVSVAF